MTDVRHLEPSEPPTDRHRVPGQGRGRIVALVAGVLAVALAATLVFVVLRPSDGPAGMDSSAAVMLGWGEPVHVEDFDGPLGPQWQQYDGEGHAGQGVRSPGAITVSDGVLTITGDPEGTTGGMAWDNDQKYGRWEGRVRAPASDPTYNALLLLWPEDDDWPASGEVDFMEMTDPDRQRTKMFVHFTEDGSDEGRKVEGEVFADATEWHNWAVEWTPDHISAYLDGVEWYRETDPVVQPPGPMHLTIQLDWLPGQGVDGSDVAESTMEVDWVRQYPYQPGS